MNERSRRRLIWLAVPLNLAILLAACGPNAGSPSPSESAGPWSFSDDTHSTISTDQTPARIVAQEDSAAALWAFGIRPIAVFGNQSLSDNPQFEGVDISGVENVGQEFGEINIEKIAALGPDLIVTSLWPSEGSGGGGFKNATQQETIAKIAPIVQIEVDVPYSRMIDRYEDLAVALGADLDDPAIASTTERYQKAFVDFAQAVRNNPKLKVLAVSPSVDQLYVGVPGEFSDLQDYWNAGMDLVSPESPDLFGTWETLSWEEVDAYDADIVLYDARPGVPTPEKLDERVPTWGLLPAVKAGQIAPWYVGTAYDLNFFTEHLEELTALIQRSEDVS